MTVQEAASQLGVSGASVIQYINAGKLKGAKVAKGPGSGPASTWSVNEESVAAFLLTRKPPRKVGRKPGTKAAVIETSRNGHDSEKKIRQVIDSWLDEYDDRTEVGELTRNEIQDLARRIKKVV